MLYVTSSNGGKKLPLKKTEPKKKMQILTAYEQMFNWDTSL